MACSKEEIERKRLAALQKRQSKLTSENNAPQFSPGKFYANQSGLVSAGQSGAGPIKSFSSTTQKGFHPYAKPSKSPKEVNNIPVTKIVSGTVYLISEEKFEVNPSEFCTPLINIFKTIPSRKYDAKSKLWNFSLEDYELLMSKVAPLAPHVVLGPLPSFVLKILREAVKNPSNVDLSPVEATLRHQLMPFQEDGVRFAIARGGRCMIADDMGLGKTFQALAVASYYRHNWPLLIVTTSSMRETWQSKIHELLPSVPLMNIVTLTSSKDAQLVADRQTEVVIVSYKITTMHTELLKNKNFGFVIIDESHYLKSHKAQCTIALSGVTRRVSRCVLLSGTPALSRPAELFTQLTLIEPRLMPSFTEYGKRYCDGKQTSFGWDMTGQSNLAELQVILQRRFLIRRTKEQVLTKLEEKTRETVLLDQTLLQFSKEDEAGLSHAAETYKQTKAAERHSALITYFSETARVKIPAICKYIRQQVRENAEKFLVFAHHRCVIDAICSELDEAAIHYICIVGSTPANSRAELVDKFQHGTSRCCVLSVTAACSGLTLTAAALVVFAELHWNPGILTQAEARAHRIGQLGAVRVRYLLAQGTADDLMWPMLQGKLNVLNNVGLSKDTFEDTTMKHQESKNHISQYLTSPRVVKNKNDYIPGTNIRKESHNTHKPSSSNSLNGHSSSATSNGDSISSINGHHFSTHGLSSNIGNNLNSDVKEEIEQCDISAFFDKSFFDEDEDDELLAKLDL